MNKLLPQARIPGLLPLAISPAGQLSSQDFSFAGGADSFYEYMLKTYLQAHNLRRSSCRADPDNQELGCEDRGYKSREQLDEAEAELQKKQRKAQKSGDFVELGALAAQ